MLYSAWDTEKALEIRPNNWPDAHVEVWIGITDTNGIVVVGKYPQLFPRCQPPGLEIEILQLPVAQVFRYTMVTLCL